MKNFILIPAKDEEKNIGKVVDELRTNLDREKFFILVVDDGSKDNTLKIAVEKADKVIRHEVNMGKGFSIRHAVLEIFNRMDYNDDSLVIIMDADYQHNPQDLKKIIEKALEYDVVIGVRNLKNYPPIKKIGNKLISLIVSILTLQRFRDTESGFRVFKIKVLKDILKYVDANKYEWEIQSLIASKLLNYKVGEVEVSSPTYHYGKGVGVKTGIMNVIRGVSLWLRMVKMKLTC